MSAATEGSGTAKSEERPIGDFDKIELEGVGTLIITQGAAPALTVKADDNILGELSTTVDDKSLKLKSAPNVKPKTPIEYHVSVKNLKEIEIEGAAEVKSDGTLMVDTLTLEIEGAAKVDLVVQGKELDIDIDGAGQVTIAGSVDRQQVEIDGAGKYHGIDLKTKETDIEINGAGKAQVYATDKLDVEVNGAGSVTYKGSPKVTQKIRGIGSVTQAGGTNQSQ